ncbi:leucine--tRNA ligase [Leeuwenhoekiella parthenopeia]|uniref:Leucine--tRNA ligase n=1 Tax=Leeuwenhoekiella parthenopeia TaxID=2890320 RepID=A0ABS8GQV7_9FLAO|nr:class I tRNA ligase family protein [Leeuwenhoekiella parthenopeia]MCC4211672.1 leucine--tRNA ligase [Leeuwenhoekiella parthenopeia]
MNYDFNAIEKKWQQFWKEHKTFEAENNSDKPKYYVLDMFPYPSGAGLHVGHPLGYIASDIYARYKRHQGFNVLHPQGYDSFGLPAEQYAIQTGQHPAITTETNIARYREQLDKIGFSFDWSREVRTSNPEYYKWTQWIFIQLFESWYNNDTNKAEHIDTLIARFEAEGNASVNAVCDDDVEVFSAEDWNTASAKAKQEILLKYRLTYLAETEVNWCPALGTVLANDEIVNGVSERGGHPVVRKKMTQWSMRISAYAQRLLDGLQDIDWPQPLKDSQTNWIGRSKGASVEFRIQNSEFKIGVFTTRPDTIFGVTFMTLAPELDLVKEITTPEQKAEVDAYIEATAKRSERERMADVKTISGAFTGAYAEHPFTKEPIPIWIGDYVLAGYGTGAVMAVPCGDQRDWDFARHFNIPIKNIFEGVDISEQAYAEKDATPLKDSDFLNGLAYKEALPKAIEELEKLGAGKGKVNYRLRDAVFSRQRYWGEPFPVYYVDGMPQTIDPKYLPLELPEVEKYLPTEEGEPPLGRATKWHWDTNKNEVVSPPTPKGGADADNLPSGVYGLELNTMPGWAGSSWYFFRYMEKALRDEAFASKEAMDYWQDVDLYIGGSEHATGHLLYSRFWVKFLKDRGFAPVEEPFKKLINQGMILGESAFVHRVSGYQSINGTEKTIPTLNPIFLDYNAVVKLEGQSNENLDLRKKVCDFILENTTEAIKGIEVNLLFTPLHVNVEFVNSKDFVNISKFREWSSAHHNALILNEEGEQTNNSPFDEVGIKVSREVEKMSKSKYNVVNPDDICEEYGADTLRMYEMFLGPLEQAKPWNTAGITGVHNFLKKLWKLYHKTEPNGNLGEFYVDDTPPSGAGGQEAMKTLHKTIKKVQEDIENFSFNTSVSTFMIAVNELSALKCNNREVLEPLAVLISPYAPHIAEELWSLLGHEGSIATAPFPKFDPKHLVESSKEYPISFNGKMRFTMELPLDLSKEEIEKAVRAHEKTKEYLDGREPKKVIVVPGKIVNFVG